MASKSLTSAVGCFHNYMSNKTAADSWLEVRAGIPASQALKCASDLLVTAKSIAEEPDGELPPNHREAVVLLLDIANALMVAAGVEDDALDEAAA